jgi:ABC-type multidrug transport system permease subunit
MIERIRRHQLTQLTLMRIREFSREPEAVFWAVFFPVLLATGLGIAFSGGSGPVYKIAATSPAVVNALRAEPGLDVRELSSEDARKQLLVGDIALIAEPGEQGSVLFRYDETNPDGRSARTLADAAIQRAAGRVDPVRTTDSVTREPGGRYIDFVIPGLIGVGIMSNAVWGIGFTVVDSRRRKLLKRLAATPMSRAHYLLSYLIWRKMILVVEVVLPIAFGAIAFGVPVRGSWWAIAVISVLCSLAFGALGLLLASRARTIEGVSGLVNLAIVPMWIVSGVFFSSQRFPDVIQPVIRALPLTAFIDATRGILLQGNSLATHSREMVTLAAWTAVCFVLALRLFRWR